MSYSLKSVFKGSTIYTIGQLLTQASGFFLIPIYTRYLTTEDYGIIGIIEVLLALMAIILMFGGLPAQTRFYYEYKDDPDKVGSLLFSINTFLILVVSFICLMISLYGEPIFSLLIKNNKIKFNTFILITTWTALFKILDNFAIRFYVATREYLYCALLQFFLFILNIGAILLFVVYFKQGALGKVKGHFFGNIIFFVFFYWIYARNFRLQFRFNFIKDTLSYGMPIVLHLISGTLLNLIDRVILDRFVSLSQVGIYTLGYQIGMVMNVIVNSVNKAWTPNYYELMEEKNRDHAYEVRKAFYVWLTGIGTVCLFGSLFSKEILLILTPPNFHESAKIVPVILFSYMIEGAYFFVVAPIFYYKKTKILAFTTTSAAILNIVLNFVMIPRFGIFGAAYATLISFFCMGTISYLIGKRLFDPEFDIFKVLILTLIMAIPSFWLGLQDVSLKNGIFKIMILIGFVSVCYSFFKQYLDPLVRIILSVVYSKSRSLYALFRSMN